MGRFASGRPRTLLSGSPLQRPAGKSRVDVTCPPPAATTKSLKSSAAASIPASKIVDVSTPKDALTLCRYVCPNRNLARLLFELLVLTASVWALRIS